MRFVPDAAQTFRGQLTISIAGVGSPEVIPLFGTGYYTGAVATVSTKSISFGSVALGRRHTQAVTISNTGTSWFNVLSVNADPPFQVVALSAATRVPPGSSLPLQVTLYGTAAGNITGELTVSYDVLPSSGVKLSGTVTPDGASAFVIPDFPRLPSATQGAAYLATLTVAGGLSPYTWSLASGSTLPAGLTLSASGTITGTFPSTLGVGRYLFTAQVTDSSSPPKKASAPLVLPVGAPTGASCWNIVSHVGTTNNPLIALTDLGTGTYLGEEGGLYPNGSNVRPADHDAAGVTIAQSIQPLDVNGNPDPTGKYALLSVGMSEAGIEFVHFIADAYADPSTNSQLVIVNGANPQAVASLWADPTFGGWSAIMDYFLPQAGVTANQVVAAWVKDTDNVTTGFPSTWTSLQTHLENIAQNLHTYFPNLKLLYFSTRIYGGHAIDQPGSIHNEPYAYQTGFAVKWAIQDQLNGDPNLNYDPSQGPVMATWMSWGPYDWANGLLARTGSLVWTCQDIRGDGIHPSNPAGREKDANMILNFFKTDDTTTPWFLAH